jgi:hypothetical protein
MYDDIEFIVHDSRRLSCAVHFIMLFIVCAIVVYHVVAGMVVRMHLGFFMFALCAYGF